MNYSIEEAKTLREGDKVRCFYHLETVNSFGFQVMKLYPVGFGSTGIQAVVRNQDGKEIGPIDAGWLGPNE